jgi:myo-inositol-1(or 4)-monophosphatase
MTHTAAQADLAVVAQIAQQAGDLILAMQADGLRAITGKSSAIDLVTEADVASEKLIRSELSARYPAYDFWGEESNQPPQAATFWVVDPIDGTSNFANGLPYFAVNIALQHDDQTLLGVTLELPARRLYFAQAGGGAFVRTPDGRERPLRVNQAADLNRAFLSTGFPYHRSEYADNNLAEFGYFLGTSQGVRCMGSAALDLVNVASGALAAYWEGWLKPWDAAPGALLVREAGGLVTDYRGAPWTLTKQTLVASNGNPALHTALLDGIHQARQGLSESRLPADETA